MVGVLCVRGAVVIFHCVFESRTFKEKKKYTIYNRHNHLFHISFLHQHVTVHESLKLST